MFCLAKTTDLVKPTVVASNRIKLVTKTSLQLSQTEVRITAYYFLQSGRRSFWTRLV